MSNPNNYVNNRVSDEISQQQYDERVSRLIERNRRTIVISDIYETHIKLQKYNLLIKIK